MDKKKLKKCREVTKSWQKYIDVQNILWKKIANIKNANKVFQLACKKGHFKIVEMLLQKPNQFSIDFNTKDGNGVKGFHFVCINEC